MRPHTQMSVTGHTVPIHKGPTKDSGSPTAGGRGAVKYVVQIVNEDELPDGLDMVIVERGDAKPPVLLVSGRPAEVWRAMRALEDAHGPAHVPAAAPTLLYAV